MTPKEAESLAKRKYPYGKKEKECIEAFGKMIINRANYKRELLHMEKRQYSLPSTGDVLDSDNKL